MTVHWDVQVLTNQPCDWFFQSTNRFNEDCQYPHCGYREHQTHFHCMRTDCGYSFCDKTRFVQVRLVSIHS